MENIRILLEMKSTNGSFESDIRKVAVELDNVENEYRGIIEAQKTSQLPFDEYEVLAKECGKRYDTAREKYNALIEDNRIQEKKVNQLEEFIQRFEAFDGPVNDYNYDLMKRTVENMTVNKDITITVRFVGDQEVTIEI